MLGSSPKFLTYEAGQTLLHRLDARTKLLLTVVVVVDALIANVPAGMVVTYALAGTAGLSARGLVLVLWRAAPPHTDRAFGLLVVVVTPGKALGHFWIVVPTRDGVALAVRLALQAFIIVFTTSLLTLTTPPLDIASSLQWALGGWSAHVPVRDIIAMVAIGPTFVPLLIEEVQRVIAAQRPVART
jgi:energy-coupling factor transport system permease protein